MKRILAMLLALVLVFSIAPMAMADAECSWGDECPSKGYTDLPADAWYHEYVDMMIMAEVMIGTSKTTFDPNGSLTRAQAAVLFHRTFEEEAATEKCTFTDVPADAWYADAVAFMQEIGLIKGMGNDTFAPDVEFTREQYAVVMLRLSEYIGWYQPAPKADLDVFKDSADVSDWAKEAMLWAVNEGVIKGDDKGNLNPTAPTKRSEAATVFVRLSDNAQDYVVPDEVVKNEEELVDAIDKGGEIVVENEAALPESEIIKITEDTILYLYEDFDASANTSRPFEVAEDVYFSIVAKEDVTVKMGKYGLINIPNANGVTIDLQGGNYEGATDFGSFIKPRGEGEANIYMTGVNVKDDSDNGGWLIDATSHTGDLNVEIYEGTFSAYNGITSAENIEINGADMTFKANGIQSEKYAKVNNSTIKVTKENTASEQHAAPSAAIIVYNNGYISVANSTLDCAGDAMAVYTSGGTIEAEAVDILNGTISEYHPRDHYPDAEFLVTVDGEVPADLLFPNCEGKTPCADCTTFVADEDELRAAITAGGKIALIDDIKMDADATITVASGKKVDLNLNTNTIAGVSDVAGRTNREMFLVKGEMNVCNGTITIDHTGEDMEWDAMTTIFDVTGGGVLNVKDALIENLGGTAMTFAVHLNNWGEVTLNAENTTFKAPYTAVRVFNSGFDMNNVSFKECVLHGDSRAFWVHNYIGDLDSKKHSDDAIKARLNIDLINGTNEITNGTPENPKNNPIRYGFASATYYDALGNDVTIR